MTLRLFLFCLLVTTGLRAQLSSCTLGSAQTIDAALADLQAAQPVEVGQTLSYCVRTNSLLVPTATLAFTTNQGGYPFSMRVTNVADQSEQLLTEFGDAATVEINQVYFVEFEGISPGTGEVTVSGGSFTRTVEGVVERAPLPLVWGGRPEWRRTKGEVHIVWETLAEVDVSHYLLEELGPIGDWDVVAETDARGAGGYKLKLPDEGVARVFLIVAIDFDGSRQVSPLVELPALNTRGPIIAPNPSNGTAALLGLSEEEIARVEWMGIDGRNGGVVQLVNRQVVLPDPERGYVFLRIVTRKGKVFTRKMVVY